MQLIAESGATTTTWICFHPETSQLIQRWESKGLNPVSQDAQTIQKYLTTALEDGQDPHLINQLAFYGAGCTPPYDYKMHTLLQNYFPNAEIIVESDLKAAAIACCNTDAGLVGILGTGSNLCYYDGTDLHQRTPALGYILGDEGSGSYLGKALLRHYLYQQLPQEIHDDLQRSYHLSKSDILDQVYRMPNPKQFLAEFAPFLHRNQQNPHISQLISDCFQAYISNHLTKFEDQKQIPVHFVGSIAFHFKSILTKVIENNGFKMGNVYQAAIDGLIAGKIKDSV